jgi:predicted RNA-binding protein with PIN domain
LLIIDAFNVLHASAKAGLGRIDVGRLRTLIEHSHWTGEHVVLVFDGSGGPRSPGRDSLRRPEDAGLDLESKGSGISEVYAARGDGERGGGRGDADSVIESLLDREELMGRGRLATVVSSDKRVRAAATGVRAKSLSSEQFLHRLAEDVRKVHAKAEGRAGGRPEFATDEGMDAGRTEYWLREFGLGAKGEPAPASKPVKVPGPARGSASKPTEPTVASEEWGGRIDADDVDMDRILRQKPPSPARDKDDHASTLPHTSRKPRRGR